LLPPTRMNDVQADNHQHLPADSLLGRRLAAGKFVMTAELTPPLSTDPTEFIAKALPLKDLATAVNVTDGAGAKAHMSSVVAAHYLLQSGIEPILQMTCRDRNRIALQGDLIGAMSLGIRNLLVLSGDDPKAGDQPDTKPVFDLKSQTLLQTAHRMRTSRQLPTGAEIKGRIGLVLGGADMPVDPPADWTPKSLVEKLNAGADFVQTQFCMDIEIVRRYAARLMDLGIAQKIRILIGVAPIPSARSARWMKEKLYGTIIPDRMIDRLEKAADPKREGKILCVDLVQQLSEVPGIAGAHIMAPQNPSAIPDVIRDSGLAA
jgi:methylenetetrahydrofolate reductase (NADPH)